MNGFLINRVEVKLSLMSEQGRDLDFPDVRAGKESSFLYENNGNDPNQGEVTIDFNDHLKLRFVLSGVGNRLTNPAIELGDTRIVYRVSVAQMLELLKREYGPDGY